MHILPYNRIGSMYCEFYYFYIFETRPRSSARQYESSIWTLIARRKFWSPHLKICHSNVLVVKQTRYSIYYLKLYSNSRITERTWYFVGVGGIPRLGLGPKAYLTVLLFCRIDVFLLFRRLSWGTAACPCSRVFCFYFCWHRTSLLALLYDTNDVWCLFSVD